MAEDLGFLPDTQPAPTPDQAASATTKALSDEQAAKNLKGRLESLDFDDPASIATSDNKPDPKPTPEASPVAAQSGGPEISVDLLARARSHGFTESQAKKYSPELLEQTVLQMDLRASDLWNQANARQPRQQQQAPPPEPELTLPDLPTPADEGMEWDPNLRQWVDQSREAFNQLVQQNKLLQQHVTLQQQQVRQQQAQQVEQQFEDAFAKVPAEYKEAIGEGAWGDLQGTQAANTRMEVARTMGALRQSYVSAGQTPPSFQTLFTRALRAVAEPKAGATPAPDKDQQIRDHQGRFMAPPTARKISANSTQTNTDEAPKDPKAHEQWVMNRFKARAASVFGEDN